jgi:hypothetical protein
MTFQMSSELKQVVDEVVMEWIHLHHDEISTTIKEGTYVIADEDERENVIMFELFNYNSIRDFGKFCESNNQRFNSKRDFALFCESNEKMEMSYSDEIREYCNNYLENTYGPEFLLMRINDLSYLCKNLGTTFGIEHKTEITEWFDSIDAPFLK